MTDLELTARVRAAHGDAWEAQGRLREAAGGGALELRGIRLMASGLPYAQFNNGDVTEPDPDLEGARAFYAQRRVPWGVCVPSHLPWPHGRHLFRKRLMGLPAAAFQPVPAVPGLQIERAGPGQLETVVAVDTAAFVSDPAQMRPWLEPCLRARRVEVALATLGGEPVATALALRSGGRAGPCLCLGGVAVLAAARRRGVGAAISSWLLARGLAAGAQLAHLQADSDDAARVYARLGFAETGGLDVYVEL
jgi:GNAT superfamily N-acetyltransferase